VVSTFLDIDALGMGVRLQRLIEGPASVSVSLGSQNLLRIKAEYHDIQGKEDDDVLRSVIVLDKTIGFRPVFYQDTWSYLAPDKLSWGAEYRMSWKEYGRTWYVSEAGYRRLTVGSYVKGEEPRIVDPPRSYARFVVDSFTPDVNIPDSEFTLDALRLPEGTLIYDSVAGVSYRYGTPPVTAEQLEAPLAKAAFPQKIAGDTLAGAAAAPEVSQPTTETTGGAGPGVLGEAAPSYWRYIVLAAVAALILLGVLWGRRRCLACRKE
jgi:hypothetical protein